MKNFKYLFALFIIFNTLSITSCTTDDLEEEQFSLSEQKPIDDGEDVIPPDETKN